MKHLIYLLTFIISATVFSQTSERITQEKQKLKQALAYGDKVIAASSMYTIISIEGPQSTYKDSLAYLYFNARNFVSCFLVANDILKDSPDKLELLEMKAISLESMGAVGKASEAYLQLFSKTNNNYHAYKLASLQLGLKKFDEAYTLVKKAAQLPDDGSMVVTFQINKNYNQKVNLKAAIAYLEGIIALNLKKEREAKVSFSRAIELFPEFVLAKGKLESLNVKEKQ